MERMQMQAAMTEAQQKAQALLADNARLRSAVTEKEKAVKELLAKKLQLQELAAGLDTNLSKVNAARFIQVLPRLLHGFLLLLTVTSSAHCRSWLTPTEPGMASVTRMRSVRATSTGQGHVT